MSYAVQKATIGDETVTIYIDHDVESPRESWDHLGKMICFHRRYNLGDKHDIKTVEELNELLKRKDVIALPVYLYDHSGLSMSTDRSYPFNDRWDSMMVGYIYVTHDQIKKEYSKKRISRKLENKVLTILEQEVKTYDLYLRGEIYGFVLTKAVTCEHCGHIEHEHIDSCWGFYGYDIKPILEHLPEEWKNAKFEDVN